MIREVFEPARRRRRRPWRRIILWCALAATLVGVAGAGVVVSDGLAVRTHLLAAARLLGDLRRQVTDGQGAAAARTLASLHAETAAARRSTRGTGWRLATRTPWLGDDATAVATIARVLDDLATTGLPELVDTAGMLHPAVLAPRNGRIALDPLRRSAPKLRCADAAVSRARDEIAALPTAGLSAPVASALLTLRAGLTQAASLTTTGVRATTLLPALLGADGPRTILVMFQNPAEIRATGGMPGAFAIVRATRGRVRLAATGTAAGDLGVFEPPVAGLSAAERQVHTDRPAIFPADVNLGPDFPMAARLFRQMYRTRTGQSVDTVIATDPVAVSYLLGVTGPVTVTGGPPLSAATAVRTLLSDVYARFPDPAAQDRYFAAAIRTVFATLMLGLTASEPAVRALGKAASEGRLLVWSARAGEQRVLAGTRLAGELPADDAARPTVGVFVNDGSGAKLGYYLTRRTEVAAEDCPPGGRARLRVRLTLGSAVPRRPLPTTVLGLGLAGDPYTMRVQVLVYSPVGGAVATARLDGVPAPLGSGLIQGRAVAVLMIDVPPGGSRTAEVTVLSAPADHRAGAPALAVTPGLPGRSVVSAAGCVTATPRR